MPRRPLPDSLPQDRTIEVANRLNSVAIHLLRRISHTDGVDGVTGARLSALSVLVYGGPQTVGQLARREGVAGPTMTRIAEALVRDGLVVRAAIDGDRRSFRLEPTPEGRALMERGRARRIEGLAAELLGLTDEQMTQLERALDVLEHLETKERSG